ncbi:MAG: 2-dehydropantoate 2-reductase [Elusimicrobia bacterium]|nr:2-dehydropantoate 2-reductase [Elusimicrobiota bacterium]
MNQDSGVLIVGPGSIGRLLAARWAGRGRKVRLLARAARQEGALARGIALTDLRGRRRLVRGCSPARARPRVPPPASAFFCVKASQVDAAIRLSRPWIGPETTVVALQNGLGHEARFRRAFGPRRTVIGSCYVAAAAEGKRGVAHTGGRKILLASSRANARSAADAGRLLAAAGWRVRLVEDEARMLWTKLVTNSSVNLLGTAAAVPNGELARDPGLAAILSLLIREGTGVAKAAGHPPLARLEETIPRGCRTTRRQLNSMLQDLRAGRRTEIRAIAGPILAAAGRLGIPVPTIEMLARVVGRLERTALSRRKNQ